MDDRIESSLTSNGLVLANPTDPLLYQNSQLDEVIWTHRDS